MGRYSNFQDPFGLALRLARNPHPAALGAIGRLAVGAPVSLLDRSLASRERSLLAHAEPSPHPVLLVVGAPRSGTTLTHQLLAAHLETSYFSNRNSLFARSPLAASKYFDVFPMENLVTDSYYGLSVGSRSPNDAFHIWNRWAGEDRYVPTPIDETAVRRFFNAWQALHPMALVSKNNRNTAMMPTLASAVDGAIFVIVKRDPVYVAQSLLEARVAVQGSPEAGWGLAQRSGGDPVEDVCRQVRDIAEMIERDSPSDSIVISYEDLCDDPAKVVKTIADEAGVAARGLGRLVAFEKTNVDRIDGDSLDRIRQSLS